MVDDDDAINSTDDPSSENPSNYIRYSLHKGSSTLASSWNDPLYFTTAFPTLFPTGLGGHLDNRPLDLNTKFY
jgi:hypothetical protein